MELEPVPHLDISGFEISVDGHPMARNGQILGGYDGIVSDRRQEDLRLGARDVQVHFDGLNVSPRLDVLATNRGGALRFRSAMNYPAYVTGGELRVIDPNARGGARLVSRTSLAPNGAVDLVLPDAGEGLVYVYRVYDARGRFDETRPRAIDSIPATDPSGGNEEGTDNTNQRSIPVHGGSVTVSGSNATPGAKVQTLGATIHADDAGRFVVQRILPTGEHVVQVAVGNSAALERRVNVPGSDVFYVGLIDIMLRHNLGDDFTGTSGDTTTEGRIAGYVTGTRNGAQFTASIDTGQDDLGNLFNNLDRKDPRSLLERLDPDLHYPVYGDDSSFENTAPTSGRLYLRVEKEGNSLTWGTFRSEIGGSEFLRQNRTLYGAQTGGTHPRHNQPWRRPSQCANIWCAT